KVVPLAYNFFKTYLGKNEFSWISDILAETAVLLVPSKSLGKHHFAVDKPTKTIKIEKDFMDYLLQAGQKRVGMGLFAQAATELTDKNLSKKEKEEIINRIAQISLTGNNRLEDAIYLFNLKEEVKQNARRLTAKERQYFLIDMLERNRSFNGRRAAKILRETFGYYGEVTPEQAEADLRAIFKGHPKEVIIEPYEPKKGDEAVKYLDRTDTFRLDGRHLADLSLIKGRRIVWDFEVDSRDTILFGGKVAYTGMMQWLPGVNTLAMFATAGYCFRTDLIAYNRYKDEFDEIAKSLKDGLDNLGKKYSIDSSEYAQQSSKLIRECAARFQDNLNWGIAQVSPELVKELKEVLKLLAERLKTSVFQLILAIRSSAVGEDSEAASFAGRQDTSLYVTPLSEELAKLNIKPEDYGYSWEILSRSVFPWYDILNRARAKLGDRIITEEMLEVFIKEWLANQRSLFNVRSIEYRLEKNIPVFTDEVEMSSMFQKQADTEFGYVAFGVNKSTGWPEVQIELIEGQTNPLVDGTGTGDLIFVSYFGKDPLRAIKVPASRETLHLPNIFGKDVAVEGEIKKGGVISVKFPKELEGMPAITDLELLSQMGQADTELTRAFGMYSDIEGGLIIRRDKDKNVIYIPDPQEPDGIAKDHLGRPRFAVVKFQTQIRPETVWNFKNPDVIEQHYMELPEEEYQRAVRANKVLYDNCQAHTQGAAKGEVFIVEKERPETWHNVINKIMVTIQSDPDMNDAMRRALAVVAAVGGGNSHTMIVATEYGLIAISGIGDITKFYNGQRVTVDATRGVVLEGDDYELKPAGNDYNVRELGIMPDGFSLGLNINSADLAQKAAACRNKPDFYGDGLVRLELLLEVIGAAGEGFLRYDNYKLHKLLSELDKGRLLPGDKALLSKILAIKGDIKHLRPRLT
ncbi:MAG: hypothetical protein FJZ16_08680, partial [Candidatus Omnitrophica bacterium]|nr:hypothetical protein [Candidatus Omnitrophota bacterium]